MGGESYFESYAEQYAKGRLGTEAEPSATRFSVSVPVTPAAGSSVRLGPDAPAPPSLFVINPEPSSSCVWVGPATSMPVVVQTSAQIPSPSPPTAMAKAAIEQNEPRQTTTSEDRRPTTRSDATGVSNLKPEAKREASSTKGSPPRHQALVKQEKSANVLGLQGCYIALGDALLKTGESRARLMADGTSERCGMLVGWCIQSHHQRALPRLYPTKAAHDRVSQDKHDLIEALEAASGGKITVKGRAAAGRLTCPVFLDDPLIRIAKARFPHLDDATIEAARAVK